MIHAKPEFIGILHLLPYKKMIFFVKFLTWESEIPFNAKFFQLAYVKKELILR